MKAEQIIQEVKDKSSEWLEMSQDPNAFIAGILANKIIQLQDHIQYLEKRLNHVSSSSNSRY